MPPSADLPWWSPHRPWGFRFSRTDLIVILVGAQLTLLAGVWLPAMAILVPFVLGHFFLFCNVFRVGEQRELLWSGTFLANVAIAVLIGRFDWGVVLPIQCVVTLIVIACTLTSADYHGIACQRINPLGYRPEWPERQPGLLRTFLIQQRVPHRVIETLLGRIPDGIGRDPRGNVSRRRRPAADIES